MKEMQQRLEQLRLEEERRKQEEEEKQRALEEAENRRLEKVFIFFMPLCVSSRCKGENWLVGVLCNVFYNGATGSFLNLTQHAHKGSRCT